jgi:hypothetical protein
VRKDKSNEFARFEMGNLMVDEYYQKFMEYLKFFPEDVPTGNENSVFRIRFIICDSKTH